MTTMTPHAATDGTSSSTSAALRRARDASARQRAAFQSYAASARPSTTTTMTMTMAPRRRIAGAGRVVAARAAPKDLNVFVESFFDLANTVAGGRDAGGFNRLSDRIGEDVYVQVHEWRLYARDMKFADGLAKVFAVKLAANGNKYSDEIMHEVLDAVRVPLGGGASDAKLRDLCPSASVNALRNILRDYVDDRL
jgi:hypothetical protein